MPYRIVRKIVTPKELGVNGDTAGDFLLDLQKKLPTAPLDIVLPNGMKLSLGRTKIEIKLPKNKEIKYETIEQIITEGTKLLLEENHSRYPGNRERMKITMSLGDNTVYFTQGHLGRASDGTVMPMNPIFQKADDTFLRVLDNNFTSNVSDLDYLIRKQHNRTLGVLEDDRTNEIAEKLGFMMVEKDDSIIEVEINGVKDPCMVTRLCIHSNEFNNEKELLESVIKTYKDIKALDEDPLLMIGLNYSVNITIGRDRKTITIEPEYDGENIQILIKTVIGFFLTKEVLENVKIKYNETVLVEKETLGYRILGWLNAVIDSIEKIRKMHGHEITLGVTLITMPLIFMFFLYSKTNPTNSYLQAAIATIPSIVLAIVTTRAYRKPTWIKTYGQKKFPVNLWLGSIASYEVIRGFGYDIYFKVILFITGCLILAYILIMVAATMITSPTLKKIYSSIMRIIAGKKEYKDKKPSIFQSRTMKKIDTILSDILDSNTMKKISNVAEIIFKVLSSALGAIAVIVFALMFLPMISIFVLFNFLNRGYWKELEKYREDIIEKAIHKYRDERNLAPSCRVIFRTTKCKRLKNPLSGSWKVLRKKAPKLLTVEGFMGLIDKLVLRGWS